VLTFGLFLYFEAQLVEPFGLDEVLEFPVKRPNVIVNICYIKTGLTLKLLLNLETFLVLIKRLSELELLFIKVAHVIVNNRHLNTLASLNLLVYF
jgi:hypothetical protein